MHNFYYCSTCLKDRSSATDFCDLCIKKSVDYFKYLPVGLQIASKFVKSNFLKKKCVLKEEG